MIDIADFMRIPFPETLRANMQVFSAVREDFELLDEYTYRFRSNIALFDHAWGLLKGALKHGPSSDTQNFSSWMRTAARDGAFCLHYFQQTKDHLNGRMKGIQECQTSEARQSRRTGNRLWDTHFKQVASVRNATAHTVEDMQRDVSPLSHPINDRNIKIPKGAKLRMSENLSDRQFSFTSRGKQVSYKLDMETFDLLQAIKRAYFGQFGPLTNFTRPF